MYMRSPSGHHCGQLPMRFVLKTFENNLLGYFNTGVGHGLSAFFFGNIHTYHISYIRNMYEHCRSKHFSNILKQYPVVVTCWVYHMTFDALNEMAPWFMAKCQKLREIFMEVSSLRWRKSRKIEKKPLYKLFCHQRIYCSTASAGVAGVVRRRATCWASPKSSYVAWTKLVSTVWIQEIILVPIFQSIYSNMICEYDWIILNILIINKYIYIYI